MQRGLEAIEDHLGATAFALGACARRGAGGKFPCEREGWCPPCTRVEGESRAYEWQKRLEEVLAAVDFRVHHFAFDLPASASKDQLWQLAQAQDAKGLASWWKGPLGAAQAIVAKAALPGTPVRKAWSSLGAVRIWDLVGSAKDRPWPAWRPRLHVILLDAVHDAGKLKVLPPTPLASDLPARWQAALGKLFGEPLDSQGRSRSRTIGPEARALLRRSGAEEQPLRVSLEGPRALEMLLRPLVTRPVDWSRYAWDGRVARYGEGKALPPAEAVTALREAQAVFPGKLHAGLGYLGNNSRVRL